MAKKLTPDDILTDFKTTKKNTKRCKEEKQQNLKKQETSINNTIC
jgi:hypothetical protein